MMIEADSRRMLTQAVQIDSLPLRELTARYGYQFSSLFVIVILMVLGQTPFMAVFWSIVVAFGLSFLRPEARLTSLRARDRRGVCGIAVRPQSRGRAPGARPTGAAPLDGVLLGDDAVGTDCNRGGGSAAPWAHRQAGDQRSGCQRDGRGDGWTDQRSRLLQALEGGGKGALSIVATTACTGIIVSVVTLTGLGLKISGIIVNLSICQHQDYQGGWGRDGRGALRTLDRYTHNLPAQPTPLIGRAAEVAAMCDQRRALVGQARPYSVLQVAADVLDRFAYRGWLINSRRSPEKSACAQRQARDPTGYPTRDILTADWVTVGRRGCVTASG